MASEEEEEVEEEDEDMNVYLGATSPLHIHMQVLSLQHQVLAAMNPGVVNNPPPPPPPPPGADNGNHALDVLDEALAMGDGHGHNAEAQFDVDQHIQALMNHNQPDGMLDADNAPGNLAVPANIYHHHLHQQAAAAAAAAAGFMHNALQYLDTSDNRPMLPSSLRNMIMARRKKREKILRERARANQSKSDKQIKTVGERGLQISPIEQEKRLYYFLFHYRIESTHL